jgi:rhodanese-related sulfurtransferase/rubrerythrin
MGLIDYFKPVATWNTDQVRAFLQQQPDGSYNLVDVRQPGEYERGHLPGAQLIPVKTLDERLAELDPEKLTITYCAAGVRSRAAASVLNNAGFKEVYSMSGGINAWDGLVAEGELEIGTAWFAPAIRAEEYLALAWLLEDGARQFYAELARHFHEIPAGEFFKCLVAAEDAHKETLHNLYHGLSTRSTGDDFPVAALPEPVAETMLEGGLPLAEALRWLPGKTAQQALELAISLEVNAYDRYQIMSRNAADQEGRQAFERLACEEKTHLGLLCDELDRWLEHNK